MLSVLSVIGVALGITAVIALVSIGKGVSAQLRSVVLDRGSNVVSVMPGPAPSGASGFGGAIYSVGSDSINLASSPLSLATAAMLERESPPIGAVLPLAEATVHVAAASGRAVSAPVRIIGSTAQFPEVRSWQPTHGRFFTDNSHEAVLGANVVADLFGGDPSRALGSEVTIAGLRLTVVGVLRKLGATVVEDRDKVAIIPVQRFYEKLGGQPGERVTTLLVKGPEDVPAVVTRDRVDAALLRASPGLRDFHVATQQEQLGVLDGLTSAVEAMVGGIATIGLIQAAASIGIIMYIAVQQRRPEIGIRRGAGASGRAIMALFVTEGLVIALIGGLIGIGLGAVVAVVFNRFTPVPATLVPSTIGLAFAAMLLVGVLGSVVPARAASRIEPVEAIRAG